MICAPSFGGASWGPWGLGDVEDHEDGSALTSTNVCLHLCLSWLQLHDFFSKAVTEKAGPTAAVAELAQEPREE